MPILKGETVLITGASAGVGRATALEFARQEARIILVARGKAGLEGAREEVQAAGGAAIVIPADVAQPEKIEEAAEAAESHFGPIDIWINNAMASVFSPAAEMAPAEYQRVTEVTYLGCVYGTLAALKRMRKRNKGTIVQVGSALAYRGIPLQSAYCGAKHAIQGFTESVRCELMHEGSDVKLTMVQLPAINTPQFSWVKSRLPKKAQPVPPIFQPEVAARAIVWAAHHYRREWWLGMSTVAAIVGNKIAPEFADRYLAETGFDSQQQDGEVNPNGPNNLFSAVDDETDFGAHGSFDNRARPRSWQFWISKHRRALSLASAGLGCALLGGAAKTWLGKNSGHHHAVNNGKPPDQPRSQAPNIGLDPRLAMGRNEHG